MDACQATEMPFLHRRNIVKCCYVSVFFVRVRKAKMKIVLRVLALTVVVAAAGCAHQPPSCDGKDRRPINADRQAGITFPSCGQALALNAFDLGDG